MMILLLSIASIITTMAIGLSDAGMSSEWMHSIIRYENEMSVISFSFALLAYITFVSVRFYRPINRRGGKWLTLKFIAGPGKMHNDMPALLLKLQQNV